MTTQARDNVDYRLLNRMSRLVICSRCLRAGTITPVPQILSKRRPPSNICSKCRAERNNIDVRKAFGKVLQFRG